MRRRSFIQGIAAFAAWPLAARAQQAKVYRIGVLELVSPALNVPRLEAFRQGLREHGYIEDRDYTLEYRSADGNDERFSDLAAELVRLNVDLIITSGTPAVLAAKNATSTIPVVMAACGEPVGAGVIASLARPGGNITGQSSEATDTSIKIEEEKQLLSILNNFLDKDGRWHPQPASFERCLGAIADYCDLFRFTCCGVYVVGDQSSCWPSQFRDDGYENAPK